jgi:hypothetical protein
MEHYADIIQECQDDLGLNVSSFHDIGMSALRFYPLRAWQIAQKNKSNSSNNNDYNGNFNKKNKERRKWLWYVELKEQRVRDIQTEML